MHILKFLRRRFPISYPLILMLVWLVVFGALILGFGMLFVR